MQVCLVVVVLLLTQIWTLIGKLSGCEGVSYPEQTNSYFQHSAPM